MHPSFIPSVDIKQKTSLTLSLRMTCHAGEFQSAAIERHIRSRARLGTHIYRYFAADREEIFVEAFDIRFPMNFHSDALCLLCDLIGCIMQNAGMHYRGLFRCIMPHHGALVLTLSLPYVDVYGESTIFLLFHLLGLRTRIRRPFAFLLFFLDRALSNSCP
ncbi:hypothetical protein ARMSODRAFT_471739 [Armillaria solidipes]|uniref:Uncharacterized protein n=1 Tax=Armillaria solidipes TaxID=1076256 RepID=A0A2H3B0D9_9AGAR|nr:hypothetical protein ARMSODRAFT_471739 [Armillaria solidipes]